MLPLVSPTTSGVPEVLLWATAAGLLLYVLVDSITVEIVRRPRPHRE